MSVRTSLTPEAKGDPADSITSLDRAPDLKPMDERALERLRALRLRIAEIVPQ